MAKATPQEETSYLPEFVLLALARNTSADPAYRKAAVEHLLEKGYNQINHPDIAMLVEQVKRERDAKQEVQAIVEAATERPMDRRDPSAEDLDAVVQEQKVRTMTAGVTTKTLYKDEFVDN